MDEDAPASADPADPDAARWLRACVWPELLERQRFLALLRKISVGRPVSWVSMEARGSDGWAAGPFDEPFNEKSEALVPPFKPAAC